MLRIMEHIDHNNYFKHISDLNKDKNTKLGKDFPMTGKLWENWLAELRKNNK